MGQCLNQIATGFKESVNSQIYVDKSDIIEILNNRIGTKQKYICISRPRRFGKTVTAEMLSAYYSKKAKSASLFTKLKISKSENYAKHLNKFNTIFINMQVFLSNAKGDVDGMLNELDNLIIRELCEEFNHCVFDQDSRLNQVLNHIYSHCCEQFIFIIDEWDCIMRENQEDHEGIKKYLDYLRALLKDQPYVALAYMTGILPIKKYGSHSALNMFDEYSMTDPGEFAQYIGFTAPEVQQLCLRFSASYTDLEKWYDGYNFDKFSCIYNPNSVVKAIQRNRISNYWTQTETFTALSKYINLNLQGLREDVLQLVAGTDIVADTTTFQNDMTSFHDKNDVLSLLIHLGYLALNPQSKLYGVDNRQIFAVRIPNEEIRLEFRNILRISSNYIGVYNLIQKTKILLDNILNENQAEVARLFDEAHQEHTSVIKYNDENSLACVIALSLLLTTTDTYDVYRELPSGKGFADLVYLPKQGIAAPALLMELKYDQSAHTAVNQILNKNYPEGLKSYHGEIYLVGINYSKISKTHQCEIIKIHK